MRDRRRRTAQRLARGRSIRIQRSPAHFVWNETDRDRVVFVLERLLKPEYRPQKVRICGDVLGAITLTMLEARPAAAAAALRLSRGGRCTDCWGSQLERYWSYAMALAEPPRRRIDMRLTVAFSAP